MFGKRTHFVVCGHFCVALLRTDFQTFRFKRLFRFSKNLQILSLRGGRVRPTRQSLTERDGIPERSAAGRISYAARTSICGAYITRILSRSHGCLQPNIRKSAAAIGLITAAGFLSAGISNRNRGFFSLCSDDAACGWPCSQSGGCAHGSRQRSVRPPPAYTSCRRTCQSADAARRPRARSAC